MSSTATLPENENKPVQDEFKLGAKGTDESAAVDAAFAELPKAGTPVQNLSETIERLLLVEKKTRLASDVPSTSRVALKILELCATAGDFAALNANILVLSKRRAQHKQVLTDMVRASMDILKTMTKNSDKVELITTLRIVSEGKVCYFF